MLGNEVFSVRLGGIYTLQRLAEEHPEQYHVQVMRQLCAFVRHPTEVEGQRTVAQRFKPREDIQAAMEAIALCHDKNQRAETDNAYWLDLHGADLRGLNLSQMNLARAPVDFESVGSVYQLLSVGTHTDMRETKLDNASLIMTDLSGVDLSGSTGLTQSRLDRAWPDSKVPPKLDNVLDAVTGEQLVWRAGPVTTIPRLMVSRGSVVKESRRWNPAGLSLPVGAVHPIQFRQRRVQFIRLGLAPGAYQVVQRIPDGVCAARLSCARPLRRPAARRRHSSSSPLPAKSALEYSTARRSLNLEISLSPSRERE